MADEGSTTAPDAQEERLSPRERRAQRAQAREGGKPRGDWKRYRVHMIIVLLWALIVGSIVAVEKYGEDCPGHWHAIMDIYVDGEPVSFVSGGFTLEGQGTPLSSHMHQAEVQAGRNQIHFEPNPSECIHFDTFLGYVDIDLDGNSITLDGDHAQANPGLAGEHVENATHTLRLYYRPWEGDWHSISASKLNDRQLTDGESVLIVFGNETEAEITALQQGATELSPQLTPQGGGGKFPLVPVMGVTIIAIVVLAVWNGLSRKS